MLKLAGLDPAPRLPSPRRLLRVLSLVLLESSFPLLAPRLDDELLKREGRRTRHRLLQSAHIDEQRLGLGEYTLRGEGPRVSRAARTGCAPSGTLQAAQGALDR